MLKVTVNPRMSHLPGSDAEREFEIRQQSDEDFWTVIRVHPWDRVWPGDEAPDRSVFVSIADVRGDGSPVDPERSEFNEIVDREEFVEGLLAVFPELQRRVAGCSSLQGGE